MLDRRLIGKSHPPVLCEIEKGAIRSFARALGDDNPLHLDEEAARAAGYPGLLAPLTFASTLSAGFDPLAAVDVASRSVLVAEQSFEYHRPICAGDKLLVTSRIVDIYERHGPGGSLDVAVIEDEGRGAQGEVVYRARRTFIVRPPNPPAQAEQPGE
ncbi:MAG: MaoC family dehydratase N-terminal domain-containing protein [Myxococcales bacterium]|jgi:acyl dehydratase